VEVVVGVGRAMPQSNAQGHQTEEVLRGYDPSGSQCRCSRADLRWREPLLRAEQREHGSLDGSPKTEAPLHHLSHVVHRSRFEVKPPSAMSPGFSFDAEEDFYWTDHQELRSDVKG